MARISVKRDRSTSRWRMNAEERIFTSRLRADEPALDVAVARAKRLSKLFSRFAASLRRDFDAINAALVLPWTTSPVKGQINCIKMLKRTIVRPRRI